MTYYKILMSPTGVCLSSTPIPTDDIWRWLEDNIPIDYTLKFKVAYVYDDQELPQLRLYDTNSPNSLLISSRPAVPNRQYEVRRPAIFHIKVMEEAKQIW